MKIAYIYDAVYPWVKGGAEKRTYEVARRLVERGHKVHWYGVGWWLNGVNNKKIIEYDGLILHGVCRPTEFYVDGRRSIKEAIYFASHLLPYLMRENFDVVDCQEFPYFPCFAAKFHSIITRSCFIITWHEVWGDYWNEYLDGKGIFGRVVEKVTAKLADNNIAVSEKTKRDLEAIVKKKVEVIPNGIDFERIRKVRESDEKSDVIFVGRLIKDKNVDVLIKAIKLLKEEMTDVKCLIIGDGPERAKLEKSVRDFELEENVEFLGFLEKHDDVISYMKASNVFVLPSTREGFGIAALEANACGLPVVTVNHKRNAAGDLVKNGKNGFLCRLSEEDISKKIVAALSERIVEKCVETSKRYDWSAITEKYERFLKEIALN